MSADGGSGFLYPFLGASEDDVSSLLDDLARSAAAKAATSMSLQADTIAACESQLGDVAGAMAERLAAGGRVFAFGNGGSATDAAGLAALFSRPPRGTPVAARSLVADEAILTALSNDVGFDVVFSRQLIAQAGAGDIAVGISTSGNSDNVLRAFEEGSRRGLLTVGLAGYDGGGMASCTALDHCVIVRSDSVHRVQEAQAAVVYALWERVQGRLELTAVR